MLTTVCVAILDGLARRDLGVAVRSGQICFSFHVLKGGNRPNDLRPFLLILFNTRSAALSTPQAQDDEDFEEHEPHSGVGELCKSHLASSIRLDRDLLREPACKELCLIAVIAIARQFSEHLTSHWSQMTLAHILVR